MIQVILAILLVTVAHGHDCGKVGQGDKAEEVLKEPWYLPLCIGDESHARLIKDGLGLRCTPCVGKVFFLEEGKCSNVACPHPTVGVELMMMMH